MNSGTNKTLFYKISLGIAGFLSFLFLLVDIAWLYLYLSDQFPQTTATTYINTVTDVNGVEHPFMKLNHYSNFNNTGKEVAELIFSFYTDERLTNVKSIGIQRVTNVDSNANKSYEYFWYDIAPEVNIKWSSMQEPVAGKNATPMYLEIDKQPFVVQLSGTYIEQYYKYGFFSSVSGFFKNLFSDWGSFGKKESYGYLYTSDPISYTYKDFFEECVKHLTKSSSGYGKYSLPLVNLSNYFSVKKFDLESKQWVEADTTTFNFNYFQVDCTTRRYGMVYASQSEFGMVANDFEFNISDFGGDATDYWQHYICYHLDETAFELIQNDDKNYLILKKEVLDYVSQFNNLEFEIEIDLDTFGKPIAGFDIYGLFGININSLKLTSDLILDFEFNDYSLWDTNLKQLIYSDNINVIISEFASNSTFLEVVV